MQRSLLCLVPLLALGLASKLHIPTRPIARDVHLPMVGLGTWLYNSTKAEAAVKLALSLGYTHIDTAHDYGNQDGIGAAIASSGRARHSFFLTTKVEGGLNYTATMAQAEENLALLGLESVDLLLLHFPVPMTPGGHGSRKIRQEQWRALEDFHFKGKARAIGVSHYCANHMEDILLTARVKPAVDQVEFHVGMGTASVNATDITMAYARRHGITFQSFSPLCGPCCMGAKDPSKCTLNRDLITGPLVTRIGKAHAKSGAQVSLKWQVQQGIPVIPKTNSEAHMRENADLFRWELSHEEMNALTVATSPPVTGGGDGKTSGDCSLY